jgi:hypothetical protein
MTPLRWFVGALVMVSGCGPYTFESQRKPDAPKMTVDRYRDAPNPPLCGLCTPHLDYRVPPHGPLEPMTPEMDNEDVVGNSYSAWGRGDRP